MPVPPGIAAVIATLQTAEPAMTGRVMAIFAAVLLGGTAAGGPPASFLATLAGPRWPFLLGAVAAVLATAAQQSLETAFAGVPPSPALDFLRELVDYLVSRTD